MANVQMSRAVGCNQITFLVIVKKSSPKNWLADCRSTVGRQSTDRLPTHYRQLTDRLLTVSKIENLLGKHVVNMT